jgi:hypothetical protein
LSLALGEALFFVGIDWAASEHAVCVMDEAGKVAGPRPRIHHPPWDGTQCGQCPSGLPDRPQKDRHAWEMRHSFVSLLSDSGMPLENISRLVGHGTTIVTETVYRKQLRVV